MKKISIIISILIAFLSCSDKGRIIIPPDEGDVLLNMAWAPDGSKAAVSWNGNPEIRAKGIYFLDPITWESELFFPLPIASSIYSPAFSATGEWLAFSYNAEIYKIKSNGDSLTQLTFNSNIYHCDWSLSDTLITYSMSYGDSGGVWVMDTDGQNKQHLVLATGFPNFHLNDSIIYVEYVRPENIYTHLTIINPIDSTTREIYRWEQGNPYHHFYDPTVTIDGKYVTLSIQENIWILDNIGNNLKQLTSNGGAVPEWSPDGSKIIFGKASNNGGELWIMNADGTNPQQITNW